MPGVRPSESWRDWNEQSFSQSGREVGGGVAGGVFISKFHSQSHAASPLADVLCSVLPAAAPTSRQTRHNGGSVAPSGGAEIMAASPPFLASTKRLLDPSWNARLRNTLTPTSTFRPYRVCRERIPEAMRCIPAPAHRSRCRNDDLVAAFAED